LFGKEKEKKKREERKKSCRLFPSIFVIAPCKLGVYPRGELGKVRQKK
jgi:hypothetical protein